MERISCIIFDLDGTLAQTIELIFEAFNYIASKYIGKRFSSEEIIGLFGPPEEIAIANMIGEKGLNAAIDDYYRFYTQHHKDMARLHPGVAELLQHLKNNGFLLAVFTGKGKRTTAITLEQCGIRRYFDMIVTGSDVKNHKPSGDGIRKIMRKFGLSPREVVMVGDAVSDVKAAHEAGVQIAAALWDSYGKKNILEMDVDYVFHTVPEFENWAKNLASPGANIRT